MIAEPVNAGKPTLIQSHSDLPVTKRGIAESVSLQHEASTLAVGAEHVKHVDVWDRERAMELLISRFVRSRVYYSF